jgi:uncharacterized protein (TIGR02145 family)
MPGIPDRMFGKADNNRDASTHSFLYVSVKNPITGRTWLSNNLGALYADVTSDNFNPAQQATASNDYKAYGSLFQWGREANGHELMQRTDGVTGSGKYQIPTSTFFFVRPTSEPYDWRLYPDDTLWENESSESNVCPVGYRLPTAGDNGENKEWEVEVNSWHTDKAHSQTTGAHALASTLKLPKSGSRYRISGAVRDENVFGNYWSASVKGRYARFMVISSTAVDPYRRDYRFNGFSVRCIKN